MKYAVFALLMFILPPPVLSCGSVGPCETKESWDNLWEIGAEPFGHPNTRPEVQLHYMRTAVMPIIRSQAPGIINVLNWNSLSSVVIAGCGFGWIGESLEELGISNVVCTETSAYIQQNKMFTEDSDLRAAIRATGLSDTTGDGAALVGVLRNPKEFRAHKPSFLLDEDMMTLASRQTVRNLIGVPGYDILTYDGYLNTFTDAEAIALSTELHKMAGVGRVVHHVYTGYLNGHTLQQWKALLPLDYFIEQVNVSPDGWVIE